jgi:4-amino-4-deoxy-L-arabinose transferase-like glycosyltransferase
VRLEGLIGWGAHYLIGVAFAALLWLVAGDAWFQQPRLAPALLVGVATVPAPWLLLQPGLGAGVFARRAARPWQVRFHSFLTHALFGVGLYATAVLVNHF